MEGRWITAILLDTGPSQTLVQQDLLSRKKRTEEDVSVRCAHGDVVSYRFANVKLEIDRQHIHVQAGVALNLLVPVLLGTDIPELEKLLQSHSKSEGTNEVMMVTTWAQKRSAEMEAVIQAAKDMQSTVQPTPVKTQEPQGNLERWEEEDPQGYSSGQITGEEQPEGELRTAFD